MVSIEFPVGSSFVTVVAAVVNIRACLASISVMPLGSHAFFCEVNIRIRYRKHQIRFSAVSSLGRTQAVWRLLSSTIVSNTVRLRNLATFYARWGPGKWDRSPTFVPLSLGDRLRNTRGVIKTQERETRSCRMVCVYRQRNQPDECPGSESCCCYA